LTKKNRSERNNKARLTQRILWIHSYDPHKSESEREKSGVLRPQNGTFFSNAVRRQNALATAPLQTS